MPIEWPDGPEESTMTVEIPDNWPTPPAGSPIILVASEPFKVNIGWTVPTPYDTTLGGSFRLRAYVESIGPGPEIQIGPTLTVPVAPGQTNYTATIDVPAGTLVGEGATVDGAPVSGVYRITAVIQHLNPNPTSVSGFVEDTVRMFRTP